MGEATTESTTEFRIAMSDGRHITVTGIVIGEFGIDEREPGKWAITHIRTGNNLSKMAARSLADARAAVALLNARPDIWRHGRFGHDYSGSRAGWVREMKLFAGTPDGREIARLCPERIKPPVEDRS